MASPILAILPGTYADGTKVDAIVVGIHRKSGWSVIAVMDEDGGPIELSDIGRGHWSAIEALEWEERHLAQVQQALARAARSAPESALIPYVPPEASHG